MHQKLISFFSSTLVLALVSLSCSEFKSAPPESPRLLTKEVGKAISYDVARRWMGHYRHTSATGRYASDQRISVSSLSALAAANPNSVGIALHHAVDAEGAPAILLVPVAGEGTLWQSASVLDAKNDQLISLEDAQAAATRYTAQHPGEIWYHFFGANVIDEIVSTGFSTIEIAPALNDDGEPQLLLLVWSGESQGGKTDTEDEPLVYDFSNPCPPCAGIE